jgi:hypothetical protein
MRAGDHIYTRRASFTHHGIYIGNKHVIHFAGLADSLEAREIEIATLDHFKSGRKAAVKTVKARNYSRDEIVERAYRRLGEWGYDHETNNGEHFVAWCVSGLMEAEVDGEKLRPGDHLVTSRGVYTHHGIYIGRWKVIHYAGWGGVVKSGPVEVVPLAEFTQGQRVWVRQESKDAFSRARIVERAHSRLGEALYDFQKNNCEHLATWCVTGKSESWQLPTLGLSNIFE